MRDDLVGCAGDVVPAGTGHVAHRDDHGLAGLLRAIDLAPDRVRRDGRSAGAVDAKHDRLHVVVRDRGPERTGDRRRAHRLIAHDRIGAALAARDPADAVDQRDALAAVVPGPTDALVVLLEIEELGPIAALLHLGEHLVVIRQAVDELRLERLGREERPAIDERAHLVLGEPAARRDVTHHLTEHVLDHRLRRLAMRIGELGLGEHVERVLVLAPMITARRDLQLVERSLHEHRLGPKTGEADAAGRLQPHLVERGGQVVALVAR